MEPVRLDFGTRPLSLKYGISGGFLVRPSKDGTTWGFPLVDEQGAPIEPGTVNGPNDRVLVGRKDNAWKVSRSASKQVAGNIDWVGPAVNDSNSRTKVTVNGPVSRYFNLDNAFSYDQDFCYEIYTNGMYAAIAPLPVLGACLKKTTKTNSEGKVEPITWIVAFCKDAANVRVYVKPYTYPIYAEDMTGEERANQQKLYNADTNPGGWVDIGAQTLSGWTPNAPFFFSSDGTSARTTKWVEHTFSPNITSGGPGSPESLTETVPVIVSAIIAYTNDGVSVEFLDSFYSGEGFTWDEKTKKIRENWTASVPDAYGLFHSWWNETITVDATQRGSLQLCADYDYINQRWLRCTYIRNWYRGYQHNFAVGNDPAFFPDINNINRSNNGSFSGFYEEGYGLAPDPTVPSGRPWVVHSAKNSGFSVAAEGGEEIFRYQTTWDRSGSKLAASGQSTDDDTYLYFVDTFDKIISYMDIRHGLFFGRVISQQYEQGKLSIYDLAVCAKYLSFPWGEGNGSKLLLEVASPQNSPAKYGYFGWSWQKFQDNWAGRTWETGMTRRSHIGTIPTDNDNESIQEPSWKDFIEMALYDNVNGVGSNWEPKTILNMLNDPNGRQAKYGVFLSTATTHCIWTKMQFYGQPQQLLSFLHPEQIGTAVTIPISTTATLEFVIPYADNFIPAGVV